MKTNVLAWVVVAALAVACDGGGETGGGSAVDPGGGEGEGAVGADAAPECLVPTQACEGTDQCCEGRTCGDTSLGHVCCGEAGASCATPNGEDCCGALLCITGTCGFPATCAGPSCLEPPALLIEKDRLSRIGGTFLGICGDAAHTYGYHVPAARLPSSDYSLRGAANDPVCVWEAAAIDIGMDWPASRTWLPWLIREIREDRIQGIYEVIGSLDGVSARYWSDDDGWGDAGVPYTGEGHISHTHVSIYRSTTLVDHHLLDGWRADGGP